MEFGIAIVVVTILLSAAIAIAGNKKVSKTRKLIPKLLEDHNIIYYPYVDNIYLNDTKVKKPHGKVFLKQLHRLGTMPFITTENRASIGALPVWLGKTSIIGNLYYYTTQRETLEINNCLGKEFVLMFVDIKKSKPSDECIYKVITEDDRFTAAMVLAPLAEYEAKYYKQFF